MHPELERCRLLTAPSAYPKPAVFLDRDGVLIEDKHHLSDPDAVQLCPGARELIQHANVAGWPVVVITNQSGIARGHFNWDAYERVTDRLVSLLGTQAPLAAIYANGHGPQAGASSWRKPSPAMLLAAAQDLHLDLNHSLVVGDRISDLQAGAAAGLPWLVHVLTGHGHHERDGVKDWAQQSANSDGSLGTFELILLDTLHQFPLERVSS